jgi:magnesium-transporting ATPase (P-type)
MFLLLVGTGTGYLVLGEATQAAALLGAIFVIIIITFYQKRNSKRSLQALRDLSSRALSWFAKAGPRASLPARLCAAIWSWPRRTTAFPQAVSCSLERNLSLDKSLLTGESIPVTKARGTAQDSMQSPDGDRLPCVFSGTLVVRGLGTFDCLPLAICMMPEEFPVVLAVFLALVAWPMSRQNVLTRRAAIDSFGAGTVLCVENTGALAPNRNVRRAPVCLPATGVQSRSDRESRSLRFFFFARLRAKACFTRRFSPGLR